MGRPKKNIPMKQFTMRVTEDLYSRAVAATENVRHDTGEKLNIQTLTERGLLQVVKKIEKEYNL